jgi:hypothetical protein
VDYPHAKYHEDRNRILEVVSERLMKLAISMRMAKHRARAMNDIGLLHGGNGEQTLSH